MCDEGAAPGAEVQACSPRHAAGPAVDPIALEPVDEVVVTTLMDNSYDALLGDTATARRTPFTRLPAVAGPQFIDGRTVSGLVAEHGFSALVTTRRANTTHTEPVIEPTVAAFTAMAPDLLVPAHCTGWTAQYRLAATLPAAFVPNAAGTSFTLGGTAA